MGAFEERSIFEIFEMIFIVLVGGILLFSIIFANDPYNIRAQVIASEVSYISTLLSDSDVIAELKYEDSNIEIIENQAKAKYKSSSEIPKNYFGNQINVEKVSENVYKLQSKVN